MRRSRLPALPGTATISGGIIFLSWRAEHDDDAEYDDDAEHVVGDNDGDEDCNYDGADGDDDEDDNDDFW